MKIAIIVFPGSNRETDAARAFRKLSNPSDIQSDIRPDIHPDIHMVWHDETVLPAGCDLIVLPGGFAWGDYLRAGAIAARAPVMKEVHRAAGKGMPVLGICNGFQILVEAGLLPGALILNRHLKFIARPVSLRVENNQTFFTRGYKKNQAIILPIAHHEGNYQADDETLNRIEGEGQIVMRYEQEKNSSLRMPAPADNGAARHIAALADKRGRIVGMMPHPENAIDSFHCSRDGISIFQLDSLIAQTLVSSL